MQQKVFAVRDSKGEHYLQPFFRNTPGEAEREFKIAVQDERSMMSKYPEDYDLYYLGDFDTQTGLMTPFDTPKHVAKAIALLKQNQN